MTKQANEIKNFIETRFIPSKTRTVTECNYQSMFCMTYLRARRGDYIITNEEFNQLKEYVYKLKGQAMQHCIV